MPYDITLQGGDELRARVRSIVIDLDHKLIHITVERVNKATYAVETVSIQATGAEFQAFADAPVPAVATMYEAVRDAAWGHLVATHKDIVAGEADATLTPG